MKDLIIKHLANLKFYSDFKNMDQANNFDEYIEFIDSGAPDNFDWSSKGKKTKIEKFEFDDPFLGDVVDQQTENKIEDFLIKERQDANKPELNIDDWFNEVEYHIDYLLKKINYIPSPKDSIFEALQSLLDEYKLINTYILKGKEDFNKYSTWMQAKEATDFFTTFSEKNNEVETYPLINCYPRIFKTCKEYNFFLKLSEKLEYPRADLSYIFHQMRKEKLIYYYCKPEFQELIDEKFEKDYALYPEDKITTRFRNTYIDLWKIIY